MPPLSGPPRPPRATLAAIFAALGCASSPTSTPPSVLPPHAAQRPRVVVVSIDGLMPATFLAPDARDLRVPTLRSLARRGLVARVQPVVPSVTYPAHTTLVTGAPPARHGITTNRPLDPLDKNQGGWRWYAEDIATPTLWQAVTAQRRAVALVEWPVTVGAEVDFLVPELWRAGTAEDQKLLRASSTPGLLEAVARDVPELWSQLTPPDVADDAQFAIARHLLAKRDPDLVMLHVWRVDDMQHAHGPWSVQAKAAIEHVDGLLGELLRQLETSPRWPHTTLAVVSDHGFAAVEHEIRLNVLFERVGLVTRDAGGAIARNRAAVISSGGQAFVYASDSEAAALAARAVRDLGPSVAKVVSAQEIAIAGGDPMLSFAVVAGPGYQLGETRVGEVVVATPGRGAHGYPSEDPAMLASFLAVGPALPSRDLGVVEMTAIAPTLARWVDAPLPSAASAPLWPPSAAQGQTR